MIMFKSIHGLRFRLHGLGWNSFSEPILIFFFFIPLDSSEIVLKIKRCENLPENKKYRRINDSAASGGDEGDRRRHGLRIVRAVAV